MTQEDLHKRDLSDMGALLSTREGARFFARLLELCGVFRISYVAGDTHATAFKEGQRNIGLVVYDDLLTADPQTAAKLRQAIKERQVNDD